jgi:ribosomal protein S18 acetylase RimI-like enzyme
MLTLRRYQSSDQPAVWALHNLALAKTGAHGGNGPWDDDLASIEGVYFRGGEFVVGVVDGKIVAMGALRRTSAERAEVKRMRVHPDYQGRGFGQQLLTYLEQQARALGFYVLHLDTSDRQPAAQKLYAKNGYQEVGRKPWRGMTMIFYEKAL